MLRFISIIFYIIVLALIIPVAIVIIFLEFIEGKDENKKNINNRTIGRYF